MATFFLLLLILLLLPTLYWLLLAFMSIFPLRPPASRQGEQQHFFAVAIPAHNEEAVIAETVTRLRQMDYPADRFSINIVADYCTDQTAECARRAGAIVYERQEGTRRGKGAALIWLFKQLLTDEKIDAVTVFDADTLVDGQFLQVMNRYLNAGEKIIQGQHIISNPQAGWFAALTWAMFIIDNRFQNHGRTRLGWSAKHMGDSICFAASILRRFEWEEGLTDDFALRARLILAGERIVYAPAAKGFGEAPAGWTQAKAQRARWLRGTHEVSRKYWKQLMVTGLQKMDGRLLDGALLAILPSYSTLSFISLICLAILLFVNIFIHPHFPTSLVTAWGLVVVFLFLYPFLGLLLERAPWRAYAVILSGPIFILWRTWLALVSRFGRRKVGWVRTDHGKR